MHTKQKINLASRLAARGALLINRHSRSEMYEAYSNIFEKVSGIRIERLKEILNAGVSAYKSYENAEGMGLISELEWLRSEFEQESNPNQKTILRLVEEEIILVRNNLELILQLDPELKILKQFGELPALPPSDDDLKKISKNGNQIILGDELLKCINPGTSGILPDISLELKQKLYAVLLPPLALEVKTDDELSEDQKRHILSNSEALIQYLDQFDDPHMIALFVLMIDSAPSPYFESRNFVALLPQIGFKYARTAFESNLVHEALTRLFEFVVANFERLSEESFDDVFEGGTSALQIVVLRHLAESYEYLWETDKAVFTYKRMMQLSHQSGDQKTFENGFFKIINCFEQHFEKEQMLNHLIAAIEHDNGFWRFIIDFEINSTLQKTLELKLVDHLNEADFSDEKKRTIFNILRTKEAKSMMDFLQSVENDNVSSETIKEAQMMVSNFYENDLGKVETPDEKAQALLEPLGFTDIPKEEYEEILAKIAHLKDEITHIANYFLACTLENSGIWEEISRLLNSLINTFLT